MATTSPQQSAQIITQVANQYGVPAWIPLAIAQQESGLNPNVNIIDTNGAYSTGLFQLNQKGLGAGYTPQQLLDPNLNAHIAISAMKPAYQQGVQQGLSGYPLLEYVAAHSGWPTTTGQMPSYYQQGLVQAYQQVTGVQFTDVNGNPVIPNTNGATSDATTTAGTTTTTSQPTGPFAPIVTALQDIGWLLAGVAVVIVGVWVMFNPFADLTSAVRQLGSSAAKRGQEIARRPLAGATNAVHRVRRKVDGSEARERQYDLYRQAKRDRPRRVKPRDIVGDLNEGF
ncbi:MAG: transglycosylase SLT domain-containing protein [Alicyclobacillus sp.]|nr:transglycosylase SLT domain-containing protein [Alicyclobacillus sp.]